jgi:hypothetical protein
MSRGRVEAVDKEARKDLKCKINVKLGPKNTRYQYTLATEN